MSLRFKIFSLLTLILSFKLSFGQVQKDTVAVYKGRPFVFITLFSDKSFSYSWQTSCSTDSSEIGTYELKSDSSIKLTSKTLSFSGRIEEEVLYLNNQKWFLQKSYFPNNKLNVCFEFNKIWNPDFQSGIRTEFYANGSKKLTGNFLNGKKNGTWKYFSNEGKLIKKEKWVDGVQK